MLRAFSSSLPSLCLLHRRRGNNFARWAGNAITTAYAFDAPVCPDGLPNEPSFGTLARLHTVRKEQAGGG